VLTRPGHIACRFPALRSSGVGSQHYESLQHPVGQSQSWSEQRDPLLEPIEGGPEGGGLPSCCYRASCASNARRTGAPSAARGCFGRHQPADSGRPIVRRFYPECGSSIAEEPGSRPDPVILNGGTLDDPNSLTPAMQIYCDRELAWVQTRPCLGFRRASRETVVYCRAAARRNKSAGAPAKAVMKKNKKTGGRPGIRPADARRVLALTDPGAAGP
jgi:hypothetical protein